MAFRWVKVQSRFQFSIRGATETVLHLIEAIRWEIISFWIQVLILQKKDTLNIQNQDSSLVNSNDSMHNLITLENSYHESNSIKQFFQKRSA